MLEQLSTAAEKALGTASSMQMAMPHTGATGELLALLECLLENVRLIPFHVTRRWAREYTRN
jgi:hypothetical protein